MSTIFKDVKHSRVPAYDKNSSWKSFTMAYLDVGGADQYYGMNTDIPTYKPHIGKPVWFHMAADGQSILQINYVSPTVNSTGYSATTLETLKKNCALGVMPVVQGFNFGDGLGKWKTLVGNSTYRATAIATLVSFVQANGLLGIEIDFEPTVSSGSYISTYTDIENKYTFLRELSDAMHAIGKKTAIAIPAMTDNSSVFEMTDYMGVEATGVDYICIMNYDHHYPFVNAVMDTDRFLNTCRFAVNAVRDVSKISMGIASYGASGAYNTASPTAFHVGAAGTGFSSKPGYATRKRNSKFINHGSNFKGGYALTWLDTGIIYSIPDSETMNKMREIAESFGIYSVGVWALAGNPWFSGKTEPKFGDGVLPGEGVTITARRG